jgi:phosphate transport system substrate-binding protein
MVFLDLYDLKRLKGILMKEILKYFLIIFIVGLTGCYEEQESATKGTLDIAVDESVAPTIKMVVDEFQRDYPDAKITMKVTSAREAVADLVNEKLSVIISTRELSRDEKDVISKYSLNIQTHKVAADGICILVNRDNAVRQLDLLQLKKILSGDITDWKSINKNSNSGRIQAFGENQNAGGYEYLKQNVLKGSEFSKNIYPCSTSTHIVDMVSKVPGSIGWVGLSWKPKDSILVKKNLRVLEIAAYDSSSIVQNYFEPHLAHIYRKYYPLYRPIYVYSRDAGLNLGAGFVAFLTHEGQKVILNSGLVPATYPVRLIQFSNQ